MTDRPILFSPPMVRALVEGRKTQTRRLASSPLHRVQPGDRLYVREHWRGRARMDEYPPSKFTMDPSRISYNATNPEPRDCPLGEWKWGKHRQAMHMPRWASRLTLIVTDVSIGPLDPISDEDAIAEGLVWDPVLEAWNATGGENWPRRTDPRESYRGLWNSLHEEVGTRWQDNPKIVALTFWVNRGNIDRIAK